MIVRLHVRLPGFWLVPLLTLAFIGQTWVHPLAQTTAAPDAQQIKAAQTFAARAAATAKAAKPAPAPAKATAKQVSLVPLTDRERAQQMLNRFTFGPRPGDLERVLALGPDKWFEQQLNPQTINDDALGRRLYDFPILTAAPAEALLRFPDRGSHRARRQGPDPLPHRPPPPRHVSGASLQIQPGGSPGIKPMTSGTKPAEPTEAEQAQQKKEGQAEAARIAGELFALPRNQRMAALIAMPIPQRIAFTSFLQGDQRNLLLADFSRPRARDLHCHGRLTSVRTGYQIGQELAQAKFIRAILSERQLQEVMADFWFNHFNIFAAKDSDQLVHRQLRPRRHPQERPRQVPRSAHGHRHQSRP